MLWVPQGPQPNTRGQVEGIQDKEVVGAVKAIAAHPSDPDVVYIGAVNGGIWRTKNATAASLSWEQLTDAETSLSIGALQFDPTDGTHQTLAAGTGRFSSLNRMGGALIGVLRTTDGGATWTVLDAQGLFKSFIGTTSPTASWRSAASCSIRWFIAPTSPEAALWSA